MAGVEEVVVTTRPGVVEVEVAPIHLPV